ncbi:hypothetical protein [Streptomyces sp. RG80]|uniref:hypothetical protein n=1 Tax=Streptomyces sp. RG80 TaxID=3157340 RepID=UPI00338F3511
MNGQHSVPTRGLPGTDGGGGGYSIALGTRPTPPGRQAQALTLAGTGLAAAGAAVELVRWLRW